MTATSDLDTRTGALEETTVDQETRITVLEEDVFAGRSEVRLTARKIKLRPIQFMSVGVRIT